MTKKGLKRRGISRRSIQAKQQSLFAELTGRTWSVDELKVNMNKDTATDAQASCTKRLAVIVVWFIVVTILLWMISIHEGDTIDCNIGRPFTHTLSVVFSQQAFKLYENLKSVASLLEKQPGCSPIMLGCGIICFQSGSPQLCFHCSGAASIFCRPVLNITNGQGLPLCKPCDAI